MQFRRVDALPPYAFAEVERLKLELRREGHDVIDFGFGNPDVVPPDIAVEKLREAALLPRNHRYSSSRGLPNLRAAICELYRDRFGVELTPETEATMALGAKEGLVHLLWVLLGPGDVALVPSPSYPIHLFAPGFAGAAVQRVLVGPGVDFVAGVREAWELAQPRPRVLLCSFPHNPTTAVADLAQLQELVDFAREQELVLVHDFAYADLGFDGYRPPSMGTHPDQRARAGVRAPAPARGARGREPWERLRRRWGRVRPLRAGRERAAHRAGGSRPARRTRLKALITSTAGGGNRLNPPVSDWLQTVRQALEDAAGSDLPLAPGEIEELLDLSGFAAHESGARLNAPLVCYLVGRAAAAGPLSVAELSAIVRLAAGAVDEEPPRPAG